jgi:hypothetical protein
LVVPEDLRVSLGEDTLFDHELIFWIGTVIVMACVIYVRFEDTRQLSDDVERPV